MRVTQCLLKKLQAEYMMVYASQLPIAQASLAKFLR